MDILPPAGIVELEAVRAADNAVVGTETTTSANPAPSPTATFAILPSRPIGLAYPVQKHPIPPVGLLRSAGAVPAYPRGIAYRSAQGLPAPQNVTLLAATYPAPPRGVYYG